MNVNLITNISNGAGLEQDAKLLAGLLTEWGHTPHLMHFQKVEDCTPADLNIWLEVLWPHKFRLAPRNWMIPNPEWWLAGGWNEHVSQFELIMCKTKHAIELFKPLRPRRLEHVGFMSPDRLLADVPRLPKVLHLAGKSRTKNTEAVLQAWQLHQPKAELVVVARHLNGDAPRVLNATVYHYLPDNRLRWLQNECQYHLLPSQYEGWGHAYHEGLSCGAITLTTNQPPMSEFHAAVRIPAEIMGRRQQLAPMSTVTPKDIARAINQALTMEGKTQESQVARAAFLKESVEFKERLKGLLG